MFLTILMGEKRHTRLCGGGISYPHERVPQLEEPDEEPIPRLDSTKYRVPGSPKGEHKRITKVKGG